MSAENDIKDLELLKVSSPHEINISHMDHRGRKTTKLVGNTSPENNVKGQNRTYEFEFKEPQFVSQIQFTTVDYADGSKAIFSCTYFPAGGKAEAHVANAKNAWTVRVNQFITKFSIEPPKKYLGDQLLTSVQIVGVHPREFAEVAKHVGAAENLRQSALEKCQERLTVVANKETKVTALDQKIENLTETLDQLSEQKSELEAEIESTQATLKETERSINSKTQELSEYSTRIETAVSTIEEKSEKRRQLSAEITQAEAELRGLKENINMFPTEISGFVDQGASSIRKYTYMAAVPIAVIGAVTIDLFVNASELSQLDKIPAGISVWEILIARFPYVLVCGALLASSYKLARVFIAEIIRINEQRLNLTKISIIAKDVSDASEDSLPLDPADLYEKRTYLKMNLLRAHLKGYLAEDYEYEDKTGASQGSPPEGGSTSKN